MSIDAGCAPPRRAARPGRPRPAPRTLSQRLACAFLVVAAISVLGADVYSAVTLSYRLQQRTDRQIAENFRCRIEALRAGRGLIPATDGSASVVLDGRGAVRYSTGLASLTDSVSRSSKALRAQAGTGRPEAVADRPLRAMVGQLPDGDYLVTAQSTDSDRAAVRTLVGIESAISLPLIGVLLAGTLWSSRRTLLPIRDMARTARRIADGKAEPSDGILVVPHPLRELQCAADTFNYLLHCIEQGSLRNREAERGLHDLVGAASHELRTPLTTITGYAQLARLGALDDPDRLDVAMEQVQRETLRMAGLVEDLLLLARLSQGGDLERRPVDLTLLCARAVAAARTRECGHTLRCVVEKPVHLVEGDQDRLEQLLGNLLANVLAHTPRDTCAEVRLRRVGDRQVIEVVDDGPGVPEAARERIFEPFFRVETAAPPGTDRTAGRGLGLSVAAAVAKAHGGSLRFEPAERGSRFRLSLPVLAQRERRDSAASATLT